MIDKEIIKQRKKVYGSNFEAIAESWSIFLGSEITSSQVSMMMALMKHARIIHIKDRLSQLKKIENLNNDSESLSMVIELNKALQDSLTDKENYLYIANNFEEYEGL